MIVKSFSKRIDSASNVVFMTSLTFQKINHSLRISIKSLINIIHLASIATKSVSFFYKITHLASCFPTFPHSLIRLIHLIRVHRLCCLIRVYIRHSVPLSVQVCSKLYWWAVVQWNVCLQTEHIYTPTFWCHWALYGHIMITNCIKQFPPLE